MRSIVLGLSLFLVAAQAAQAQAPRPSAATMAAMDRLAMMVGNWKGRGWWEIQPGRRSEFDSTERVTRRAGGVALEILGMHTMDRDGRPVVIHDAFGMIWYDEPSGKHRMKAATQAGFVREFELAVDDSGYGWSHPSPDGRGTMRYRASFTADTWRETGEVSADGQSWRSVFEMVLKRAN